MDNITSLLIKLRLFSPMFIDPVTMSAIGKFAPEAIAGVGAIGKGISKAILGGKQKRKAKAIKPVRPKYEVKDERKENAAMYRNLIQGEDPISQRAEANVGRQVANQTAQAAKYATSGADVLNMLGASQNQANQSYQDIAAQTAGRRQSQMSAYAQANKAIADEKQKAWEYNRKDKFDEDTAAKAALTEASIQNKQTGATEAIGGLAKTAGTVGEAMSAIKGNDAGGPNASKPGLDGKTMGNILPGKKGKSPAAAMGNKNLFKFLKKR